MLGAERTIFSRNKSYMKSVTPENLIQALNWRYAVKKFNPDQKISDSEWSHLQEVVRLTPSSYGLQPWKFIWVKDRDLLEKLRLFSRDQSQVTDCSHYLVIAYLEKVDEFHVDRHLDQMVKIRGGAPASLSKWKESVIDKLLKGRRAGQLDRWAERQTFIVLGQVMTAAALLGIDTCPMEGIEPEKYDEILGLQGSGFKTIATIAFGYRSTEDKYSEMKKVRFGLADLFETR